MGEMTEHHVRIVRACFGMAYPSWMTAQEAWEKVSYGPMPVETYNRLASVASLMFATMAVRERGPGGRARRSVVEAVSIADYAHNTLRVPRYVVAEMVRMALGQKDRASERLAVLERTRVVAGSPAPFVLMSGQMLEHACCWCTLTSSVSGGCRKLCVSDTRPVATQ